MVLDHQVTQTDVERLSATLQRKMKLKSVREMIADGDLETVGETLSGTIASAKELAEFEDLLEHILSLAEAFVKRNDLNQQLRWLRKGLHLVGQIFAVFPACDAGKFLESLQRLCAKATESINSQATNDINQKELISISKVSMDLALWAVDKSTANVFSGKSVLRSVDLWILIYTTARSTESEYLMDDEYLKEWYSHIGSNKTFLATRSLMILLFAHEQLGKIHSCTGDDGRLLVFFVEEISKCLRDSRLSSLTPSPCRDDMLNVAEQNFFCLYEYPNKRKRHLIDHYAPAAQLTWDRIVTLFDFVKVKINGLRVWERNCIFIAF